MLEDGNAVNVFSLARFTWLLTLVHSKSFRVLLATSLILRPTQVCHICINISATSHF